ncbi:hypothetical protein ACJX0J_039881, partial [Zea mays]
LLLDTTNPLESQFGDTYCHRGVEIQLCRWFYVRNHEPRLLEFWANTMDARITINKYMPLENFLAATKRIQDMKEFGLTIYQCLAKGLMGIIEYSDSSLVLLQPYPDQWLDSNEQNREIIYLRSMLYPLTGYLIYARCSLSELKDSLDDKVIEDTLGHDLSGE